MFEPSTIGIVLLCCYVVLGYKRPGLAFTTVSIPILILLYVALKIEDPAILILVPLLFFATMIAIAVSGLHPESRQWFHTCAWWLLITVVLLLIFGLVLVGLGGVAAGLLIPMLIILGLAAFIASAIHYGVTSRRVTVRTVFSTIGASMRQNLPLAMALECAAYGRGDTAAFVLRRIKTWLVNGYTLTESVRRGFPRCPSRALAVLAAGERIGQLPAALRTIEKDLKSSEMERLRLQPVHPFYPVAVLSLVCLIVLALMRFVMPTFQSLMREMIGHKWPWPTRILFAVTNPVIYAHGWRLPLVLLILIVGGISLYVLSRKRRPESPYVHTWILDSLRWFFPVTRWFERNRSLVQVVELLRLSLTAGSPVNEAIRSTVSLDVNVLFRSRLICWLRRVERGENIAVSARRCGLGAALAWAFDGGATTGNTPAVLETLEAYYRSNYSYRVNLARFILWPLGIVVLGGIVGFVVLAIFLPGVAIITSMAGTVTPK